MIWQGKEDGAKYSDKEKLNRSVSVHSKPCVCEGRANKVPNHIKPVGTTTEWMLGWEESDRAMLKSNIVLWVQVAISEWVFPADNTYIAFWNICKLKASQDFFRKTHFVEEINGYHFKDSQITVYHSIIFFEIYSFPSNKSQGFHATLQNS